MMEEKIKELMENEEFITSILAMETPEEVAAAFEKEDIDISVEEVIKLRDILSNNDIEELSEEDLEQVAGGSLILTAIILLIAAITTGVVTGGVYTDMTLKEKGKKW